MDQRNKIDKQVFQTDTTSRWKKFKWSTRFIFFIAAILIAVFITMLIIDRIPNLPFHQDYRSAIAASKPYLQENKYSKEYKGFRAYFTEKKLHSNYAQERAKRYRKYLKGDLSRLRNIESWNKFPA